MKGGKIAAVLIAVTIAMTLFSPIVSSVNENSGEVNVTNETAVADHDSYTELEGYDIVENSETVYWENGSTYETASSGTDYEMNYTAGSIHVLSSGEISDGANLKVSYDYQATDGTTTTVLGLVPLFVALLVLVVLASKIMGKM